MRQSPGFEQYDPDTGEELVCLLLKSLYGLKQSGRNWNKLLVSTLKKLGFHQSYTDPCLFIRIYPDFCTIAVYVDDLMVLCKTDSIFKELLRSIDGKFEYTSLGQLNWILGVKVTYNDIGIRLDQQTYFESLLEKYNMKKCKPTATPIAPDTQLELEFSIIPEEEVNQLEYQRIVGSLNYAATVTRPDLSYATGKAAQFNSCPTPVNLRQVKRMLRYLKHTIEYGLQYRRDHKDVELVGFTDANWGGDKDRKSTTGYIFIFAGAAISWNSRRQPTVALSTAEAEYMALSAAVQHALFLRNLLKELGFEQKKPTKIYVDNQAAMELANNGMTTQRTKHIDIKHHFVRDRIERREVTLEYISSQQMLADCLTKPVSRVKLEQVIPALTGEFEKHEERRKTKKTAQK